MDKIIINVDHVTGDYSIDFSNDGKGINTEEVLFAFTALAQTIKESFDFPVVNMIGLLCEQEAIWDKEDTVETTEENLN